MKRVLPPILFMFFAVGMGVVCWATGSKHLIIYPYNLIGLVFVGIGLGMAVWGRRLFSTLNINIKTFEEPGALVTGGLYKYSRNPMYLGFVIAIFGMAVLYQGAVVTFIAAFIFLYITDRWYIRYEERAMLNKFGEEYKDYCRKARRWI